MWTILLFWGLLWLPGALVAQRLLPELARGPLIARIGLGYASSLALLWPLSFVGYRLSLPIAWLALSAAALILAGVAIQLRATLRDGLLRPARVDVVSVACALVVIHEVIASAQVGSHVGGDASYHMARIRMLLHAGFNNGSPLVPGGHEHIYIDNLLHALAAGSAWLGQGDQVRAWVHLLAPAKLMSVAGLSCLAWALLRDHRAAWLAAASAALFYGPLTLLAYPNKLSPHALVPVAIAVWLRAMAELSQPGTKRRWTLGALGAFALVAAAIHPLYGVLLAMGLGPTTLVVAVVRRVWAPRPAQRPIIVGTLAIAGALALGAAPAVAGRLRPPPAIASDGAAQRPPHPEGAYVPEQAAPPRPTPKADGDVHGAVPMHRWLHWKTPAPYLLVLPLLLAWWRRDPTLLWPLGPVLPAMVVLHVPAVYALFAGLAGAGWILERLGMLFDVLELSAVPGMLLLLVDTALRTQHDRRWLMQFINAAVAFGLLAHAETRGVDGKHWRRRPMLERATTDDGLDRKLRRLDGRRGLLAQVPAGATIAAPLGQDYIITMLHDVYPLATSRGHHGRDDMPRRRRDVMMLVHSEGSMAYRIALLRHYGVRHLWLKGGDAKRAARSLGVHVERVERRGRFRLITLRRELLDRP